MKKITTDLSLTTEGTEVTEERKFSVFSVLCGKKCVPSVVFLL